MTLSSERYTVQNPFLRYAKEVGWTYLPSEKALGRCRKKGIFGVAAGLMNEANFKEEAYA